MGGSSPVINCNQAGTVENTRKVSSSVISFQNCVLFFLLRVFFYSILYKL